MSEPFERPAFAAEAEHAARTAVAWAMGMKAKTVRENGVGSDVQPLLDLRKRDYSLAVLTLVEAGERRNEAISEAIRLFDPDFVVFISEMFVFIGTEDTHGRYAPGGLAAGFAAGDPDVCECVIVETLAPQGGISAWLPYKYLGRHIEWLKPLRADGPVGGGLIEAAQAGFAAADGTVPIVQARADLSKFGEHMFVSGPALVHGGGALHRNDSCFCGSGTKFKFCHGAGYI